MKLSRTVVATNTFTAGRLGFSIDVDMDALTERLLELVFHASTSVLIRRWFVAGSPPAYGDEARAVYCWKPVPSS